ncbi:MAG: membrane protein insertion efficiency factor YidD [Actinomycetota bacterium]
MTSVRRILWNAGAPARMLLVAAIRTYQLTLSGWLGGQCRFSPTCSRYAEEAIRSLGATRGVFLATRRVLRCNPFGRGGLDPVPTDRPSYDTNIRQALPHLIRRRHAG